MKTGAQCSTNDKETPYNDHKSGSDESKSSYVTKILTSALGFFGTFMRDVTMSGFARVWFESDLVADKEFIWSKI